jgi:uncharacterized protein
MLLVKTKLGLSSIHGIGLYADEFIPKGAIIFKEDEFTIKISKEEYENSPPLKRNFLNTYSYFKENVYKCSLDNDRFMNHSDNPNTIDILDMTIANFDIQIGDEITCNYHDICDNEWKIEKNIN